MVNKNIFLLIFIFIFSLSVYSQTKLTEKDSLSIMKVLDFQQSAWNDGNIDSFMNGYIKSNDLVFSGSGGPIYGWENTKERYLK